jgi:glutamate/tyrosine decarboxylase-like PLP-dependent enzyme
VTTPSMHALTAASAAAADYLRTVDTRRVAPDPDALALMAQLTEPLAEDPTDPDEVLRSLHAYGSPATVASAGGRFFGLVVGGTLPAALGARVLASAWDQVVFNDATSPIGSALEWCAGQWVVDLLGLPAQSYVSFVTGATMGNFTCLAAARQQLLARAGYAVTERGLWDAPRLRVVASDEIHVTVIKALTLLGWGTTTIERIPTDDQGRVIADQMPALDPQTIVCLQAGNVNSGSFDPFEEVCRRARAAGAWVHVDGAFGLWAAASPARRTLTAGVDQADSWVIDGHKWLNTPYDCGLAIVRDPQPLHDAMATQAPYLKTGATVAPKDMGPEFSRSARGVEVWAALRSLGRRGVADLVESSCSHATTLAQGLRALGYEVVNDVVLNQVAARIGTVDDHTRIAQAAQESGECWFGQTTWRGQSAIRLSVASWSTSEHDIQRTLASIEQATKDVLSTLSASRPNKHRELA